MLKQAICRKRGKMRMAKSRLVLVFYMIGKVGDASFQDQSQSVVKKKKKKEKRKKGKSFCWRIFYVVFPRAPVYCVLFKLKQTFKIFQNLVSGHLIKCLLTGLILAGRENICLSFMMYEPRCARSVHHDLEPYTLRSGPLLQ